MTATDDPEDPYKFEDKPTTGSRILDIINGFAKGFGEGSQQYGGIGKAYSTSFEGAQASEKADKLNTALEAFRKTPTYAAMSDADKIAFRTDPKTFLTTRANKPKVQVMKSTINPNIDPASDGPLELDADTAAKIMSIRQKQNPKTVLKSELRSHKYTPEQLDAMGPIIERDDTEPTQGASGESSDDRLLADFGKQLANPSTRSVIGANKQKLNNIGAAKALISQIEGQPGGADQRQMFEVAAATVKSLIGNSQLTEGEINKLIPQTYKGNIDKFLEKLTNDPKGVDAQAFVDRFKGTLAREEGVANDQLNEAYAGLIDPYAPVLRRHKADVQRMLKHYKLNHEEFNPEDVAPAAASAATPKTPPAATPDSTGHVVGQQYKMRDGNMATYVGNGQFN